MKKLMNENEEKLSTYCSKHEEHLRSTQCSLQSKNARLTNRGKRMQLALTSGRRGRQKVCSEMLALCVYIGLQLPQHLSATTLKRT